MATYVVAVVVLTWALLRWKELTRVQPVSARVVS